MNQSIPYDDQAVGQAKAIKFLQMMSKSTAIVRNDRSLCSVMKAVLNYAGAFALYYGVSFGENCMKYVVDDMVPA